MKTKRFPLFYIFLLLLVIATVVSVEYGKSYLTDVLKEYEDSQYKYVAEDVLQTYFTAGNGEALAELFATQISEVETKENAAAYFNALTAGKTFSLQSVSTGLAEKIEYAVKCDDKRFASFSLEKSGETTAHGFALYKLKDATLNTTMLSSHSIQIPVGYSLKVNGIPADSKYCMQDRIETESKGFMPDGVDGIVYTTYTFDLLCAEPAFEVLAPSGKVCEVIQAENGVYKADIVYDDTLATAFSEYVIAATEAYACYLQKDANFGKVGKYMDPQSQLYENIRTSPNWMVISHNSYAFEDAQTSEFFAYSEDVFSCRVKITHVLKYKGLNDYRDYIDITWYLKKVDGKYLIYNSFNHQ